MKVIEKYYLINNLIDGWSNTEYQQWLAREIKRIESMKPNEIRWTLKISGIDEGSSDERDYIRARKFILLELPINPRIREKHIRTITEYLRV